MKKHTAILLTLASLLGWVLVLSGCEQIFTASLLSFLQRDPANLPPEQQVAWAEQALASGDPEAMAKAYELVKDDPANAYLAASLAVELSGIPVVLTQAIADLETIQGFTTDAELEAYLDDFFSIIDAVYASAAGSHYQTVMTDDPAQLSGQDMILGSLCLAYSAVASDGDFGSATPAEIAMVDGFITDGLAALPADDLARDILTQIQSFVNSGLF